MFAIFCVSSISPEAEKLISFPKAPPSLLLVPSRVSAASSAERGPLSSQPPDIDAQTFPAEPVPMSLAFCPAAPAELLARTFTETLIDVYEETGVMTDKAPTGVALPWPPHTYHMAYDRFLGPLRNRKLSMLEIGLGCDMPKGVGASTFAWRRFLPCANLTVLEFDGNCARSHAGLVDAMVVGDQSSKADLERTVAAHGPFNVVVDDGGHSMKQQIVSLRTLFPTVPPGGLYIIEDLQTSFNGNIYYQDNVDVTTHKFLAEVVGQLHHAWSRKKLDRAEAGTPGAADIAQLAVGVTCFREICVLERNGVIA